MNSLQAVLQAEDFALTAFSEIYGDQIPQDGGNTGGEDMYHSSGMYSLFEELKDTLHTWIGQTTELGLRGLLDKPKKEEESVC